MFIRLLLILSYIFCCLAIRTSPKKYFQLNADYFNETRQIFSKLDMDNLIPDKWRLPQILDIGTGYPEKFPVFVKPEWGQNSHGIERADTAESLDEIRNKRSDSSINFLLQESAREKREFEIFIIPHKQRDLFPNVFSIVETYNLSEDPLPINGIYNAKTRYRDITSEFDDQQLRAIWTHLSQIGPFRISRIGLRSDSLSDLVNGKFHVIEINLFLPMPLTLISENRRFVQKLHFCLTCMWQLAKMTKTISPEQKVKSIFFKKMQSSRNLKLLNKLRANHEHT